MDSSRRLPNGRKLPSGLRFCECGEVRGYHRSKRATCLCDGIPCPRCTTGTTLQPKTFHYRWRERSFAWVNAPMGQVYPCADCRNRVRQPADRAA